MRFLSPAIILSFSSLAANAEIKFVGVMTVDDRQKIGLHNTDDQSSRWLSIGDSFAGVILESYQSDEKTITIRRGEVTQKLPLKTESGASAPEAPESTPSGPNEYIIRPGDTGAKIARDHDLTVKELQALNPSVTWTRLKVGDKIRIP